MRIIFMGTPDFSAGILKSVYESGHEVVLVVTQPDKPKGRSGKPVFSPVKECALSHGTEVFQPVRIKQTDGVKKLSGYNADIFVVAAFGQILSKEILEMPKFGCINVHASLLPKYRGASPIQQAIIDGEKKTGVTIMQMDEGIDTGDILMKKEVEIADKETRGSLFEKLSAAGSLLITDALKAIEDGTVRAEKQDEEKASHVKQIKKSMGRIDFKKDASSIERLIRAFDPWPGTYTVFKGKNLKIWSADVIEGETYDNIPCGAIADVSQNGITVKCGNGALNIKELQIEGKRRMTVKEFLAGNNTEKGILLG